MCCQQNSEQVFAPRKALKLVLNPRVHSNVCFGSRKAFQCKFGKRRELYHMFWIPRGHLIKLLLYLESTLMIFGSHEDTFGLFVLLRGHF